MAMKGVDLGSKQIEGQVRVHPADSRRMVGVAVMAFGKHRDGVHMCILECPTESIRIEPGADVLNELGGMKIEVYLTKAHDGPVKRGKLGGKSGEAQRLPF